MLGGMALKWRWRDRMRAAGKPTDKPNMVMGINVQVCWEKFCRYWDVEMRLVPMEGDRFHLNAEEAVKHCDENTIGVVPVLGSTFDGSYEPIAEICAALDQLQADTGLDVPVHVDGASGAFVAPFIDPDVVWDFRLPRVQSINASGHKYGLVYPGVGWVVWRNPDALPDDLVFKVNYLGGEMPTFSLNFSRPGNQIVAQYYNFIRLGFDGYRRVQQASRDVARHSAAKVAELGPFELITDGSELPVFAFALEARGHALHRVRRLAPAARAGLARPGVPVPGQPRGSRGAPDRGEERLHPRPRRLPDRGPRGGRRVPEPGRGVAPGRARRVASTTDHPEESHRRSGRCRSVATVVRCGIPLRERMARWVCSLGLVPDSCAWPPALPARRERRGAAEHACGGPCEAGIRRDTATLPTCTPPTSGLVARYVGRTIAELASELADTPRRSRTSSSPPTSRSSTTPATRSGSSRARHTGPLVVDDGLVIGTTGRGSRSGA